MPKYRPRARDRASILLLGVVALAPLAARIFAAASGEHPRARTTVSHADHR